MTMPSTDLDRDLAAALDTVLKERVGEVAAYVFGATAMSLTSAEVLVSVARERGLSADVLAVALLLSQQDVRLAALRGRLLGDDGIVLQRRLSPRDRFLDGTLLIRFLPCVCRVEIDGRALGTGFLVGHDLIV